MLKICEELIMARNCYFLALFSLTFFLSSLPSFVSIGGSNKNERMLLEYDYYRSSCPTAEHIIRESMSNFIKNDTGLAAQLLRLLFHDCFIQGCDASVFLNDTKGRPGHQIEKVAPPNLTLRGFEKIDEIKKALELVCPGVVSCSDILAVATRDGIVSDGGPYYPVLTGRKDSLRSYHDEALRDIPAPNRNITHMLDLFEARGFTTREFVSLLGAHNIGKINCEFVTQRLDNFQGTMHPDPTLPREFREEVILMCQVGKSLTLQTLVEPISGWIKLGDKLSPSIQSGNKFDSHYYERLTQGNGLLHADQQLMAHPRTKELVRALASDDGLTFRREFAQAMIKLSSLRALTPGEVRRYCSLSN